MQLNIYIGIEIHKQININKLFCKCNILTNIKKINIKKKIYSYPFLISKENIYKYITFCCNYEIGEDFPYLNNFYSIEYCMNISKLFNSNIKENLIFERKYILDGSLPKGYQISGLISTGGKIDINNYLFEINEIRLEEDSAIKINKNIFNCNRLGIPLIEITFKHINIDIENIFDYLSCLKKIYEEYLSHHVYNISELGNIRQDINISFDNNIENRIEYKGFQKLIKENIDLLKKDIIYCYENNLKGIVRVFNNNSFNTVRKLSNELRWGVESNLPIISLKNYNCVYDFYDNTKINMSIDSLKFIDNDFLLFLKIQSYKCKFFIFKLLNILKKNKKKIIINKLKIININNIYNNEKLGNKYILKKINIYVLFYLNNYISHNYFKNISLKNNIFDILKNIKKNKIINIHNFKINNKKELSSIIKKYKSRIYEEDIKLIYEKI